MSNTVPSVNTVLLVEQTSHYQVHKAWEGREDESNHVSIMILMKMYEVQSDTIVLPMEFHCFMHLLFLT